MQVLLPRGNRDEMLEDAHSHCILNVPTTSSTKTANSNNKTSLDLLSPHNETQWSPHTTDMLPESTFTTTLQFPLVNIPLEQVA
ncbi:unnamed protein product [Allacma fusca]|uniref:Uncharacterized protein n=1 Tax=Allacma fusca TaxID=39272 RepID=A0A8J2JKT8_9HEXA|nr:unnamed protein product [Allacma fusca]